MRLRTLYKALLGNGLQKRQLIIRQETYDGLVLHTVSVDDMQDGLVHLTFFADVPFHLIKTIQYLLNVLRDAVKTLIDICKHLARDAAAFGLEEPVGKLIVNIKSNEYLIVFASGKDKMDLGSKLNVGTQECLRPLFGIIGNLLELVYGNKNSVPALLDVVENTLKRNG